MTKKAFTLIEVLLVVAIIAILAGIVILAINPTRQLTDATETRQQADVVTILDAVYQYAIDNSGSIPDDAGEITTTMTEICATGAVSCAGLVDLSDLTDNELYLTAIPADPDGVGTNGAGYEIQETANGRVTVQSGDGNVSATR